MRISADRRLVLVALTLACLLIALRLPHTLNYTKNALTNLDQTVQAATAKPSIYLADSKTADAKNKSAGKWADATMLASATHLLQAATGDNVEELLTNRRIYLLHCALLL